jgi:hypothetical protein
MITEKEVKKGGYTLLPEGGWIRIDPETMPHDWENICSGFGIDPECKSAILCVVGVKEEWEK